MDLARFLELVIISLATFGTRYLVHCEVFTESEQSAIDEAIEELMNCRKIPGRSCNLWQRAASVEMLGMLKKEKQHQAIIYFDILYEWVTCGEISIVVMNLGILIQFVDANSNEVVHVCYLNIRKTTAVGNSSSILNYQNRDMRMHMYFEFAFNAFIIYICNIRSPTSVLRPFSIHYLCKRFGDHSIEHSSIWPHSLNAFHGRCTV